MNNFSCLTVSFITVMREYQFIFPIWNGVFQDVLYTDLWTWWKIRYSDYSYSVRILVSSTFSLSMTVIEYEFTKVSLTYWPNQFYIYIIRVSRDISERIKKSGLLFTSHVIKNEPWQKDLLLKTKVLYPTRFQSGLMQPNSWTYTLIYAVGIKLNLKFISHYMSLFTETKLQDQLKMSSSCRWISWR